MSSVRLCVVFCVLSLLAAARPTEATPISSVPLFFTLDAHGLTDLTPATPLGERTLTNLIVGPTSATFVQYVDQLSPRLFGAVSTGQLFPQVTLTAYEGVLGDDPTTAPILGQLDFTNVRFSSLQNGGTLNGIPAENVGFVFGSVLTSGYISLQPIAGGSGGMSQPVAAPVPEPASILLVGTGAFAFSRRRTRHRA